MARAPLRTFLDRLRRVSGRGEESASGDAQLLARWLEQHDQTAFELLVYRHAPAVIGVCRRLLRSQQDIEDCFQAVFIALVRKAGSIGRREAVGGWLYRVARRAALRTRALSLRRAEREYQSSETIALASAAEGAAADPPLTDVLDAEIARLPRKYREAVVLCWLGGRTIAETARELCCPPGTVSARLTRARQRLQKRLARNTSGPAAVAFLSLYAGNSLAHVPSELTRATMEVVFPRSAGPLPPADAGRAGAIADGVLRSLSASTAKLRGALAALLLMPLVGVVWAAQQPARKEEPKEGAKQVALPDTAKPISDLERLQGTWSWVSEQNGMDGGLKVTRDQRSLDSISITGDAFILRLRAILQRGTVKLNPTANPATIDLLVDEIPYHRKSDTYRTLGIYRLEGNSLTLCTAGYSDQLPERRPTAFEPGDRKALNFVYRLAKEPERKRTKDELEARWRKDARLESAAVMKQLAIGMHAYLTEHDGLFPAPAIVGMDGKPLLSWRVTLLPYIRQGELYKQFHLDEAWDSPHNKPLLAKMPAIYAVPGLPRKEPFATYYQVFVGGGAGFEPGRQMHILKDITDGTSRTILIAEAADPVPWTKPADLPYDPDKPLPKLGGMLGDGYLQLVFMDGAVHRPNNVVNEKLLRAAITRDGGETFDWDVDELDP